MRIRITILLLALFASFAVFGQTRSRKSAQSTGRGIKAQQVDLPEAANADPASPEGNRRLIVVSVPDNLQYFVGGVKTSLSSLAGKINDIRCGLDPREYVVHIRCGKSVAASTLKAVLKAVRTTEIDSIALLVKDSLHPSALAQFNIMLAPSLVPDAPFSPCTFKVQQPATIPTVSLSPPLPEPPVPVEEANILVIEMKSGIGLDQVVEMKRVEVKLLRPGLLNFATDRLTELSSQRMPLIDAQTILKEYLTLFQDKTVFVKAPAHHTYGDIVAVIGVLKRAGANPVGILIDQ